MLYSTTMKINDEEYTVKIGMAEMIKLEERGIKISDFANENGFSIKNTMYIIYVGTKGYVGGFDEFVEMIDDSELTMEDIAKVLEQAIDKGLNKGKKVKN